MNTLPATRNVKPDWLRLVQLKLKRFELESLLADSQQPAPDSEGAGQWRRHPYCAHTRG
jgi:hypothetical protein